MCAFCQCYMYWAQEAMAWTVEHELIEGKGNDHLDSLEEDTRTEVLTTLMRLMEIFSLKAHSI